MPTKTEVVILGAGPCGLFQVFELGLLGIRTHVVDSLPEVGGQCAKLYPDKPIYDIPAIPVCSATELIDRLQEQLKPFAPVMHLGETVTALEPLADGRFDLHTSNDTRFDAGAVVLATGLGAFQPRKLRIRGAEAFEGGAIRYHVSDVNEFADKRILILGGGDSALDWTLELMNIARSITLLHRRADYRAQPASVSTMKSLVDGVKLREYHATVRGIFRNDNGSFAGIEAFDPDGTTLHLEADIVLVFFGLSPNLGPVAEWGLGIEKKHIVVDTENFQTNIPGIFAIGDISTYPGKKKLILSGFHEAALAAFGVQSHLYPERKVRLQYTTTSKTMHERLGVATTK